IRCLFKSFGCSSPLAQTSGFQGPAAPPGSPSPPRCPLTPSNLGGPGSHLLQSPQDFLAYWVVACPALSFHPPSYPASMPGHWVKKFQSRGFLHFSPPPANCSSNLGPHSRCGRGPPSPDGRSQLPPTLTHRPPAMSPRCPSPPGSKL